MGHIRTAVTMLIAVRVTITMLNNTTVTPTGTGVAIGKAIGNAWSFTDDSSYMLTLTSNLICCRTFTEYTVISGTLNDLG
jgi:hypothetical protein